jgi:hypothetical protein
MSAESHDVDVRSDAHSAGDPEKGTHPAAAALVNRFTSDMSACRAAR